MLKMMEGIGEEMEVWAVEVYRSEENLKSVFGEDFVTVEKIICAVDDDEEIDKVFREYIEKYKNEIGYTVEVTLLSENHNYCGSYEITERTAKYTPREKDITIKME